MAITFRGDTFLTVAEVLGKLSIAKPEFQRQLAAADRAFLTDAQNLYKPQREALLKAFPSDIQANPREFPGFSFTDQKTVFYYNDPQKETTYVNIIDKLHRVSVSQLSALKESIAANLPAVAASYNPSAISPAGFVIHPDWPIDQVGSSAGNSVSPLVPDSTRLPGKPTSTPLVDHDVYTPLEATEPGTGLSIGTVPLVDAADGGMLKGEATEPGTGLSIGTVPLVDAADGGMLKREATEPSESGASAGVDASDAGTAWESAKVTNPVKAGSPVTAGGTSSSLTAPADIEINPRRNELNNYSSYTYNIALYMLTPKEYIKMMKNPKDAQSANKFLIARSGGIGAGEKPEAKHFDVDFFIDNLQLTNMGMSPNTQTSNTNAVEISFELNEPNGVTLLERLQAQAKLSLEAEQSYIHAPYLLEITFKGYDDLGEPHSGDIKPKYIPIKIGSIKFSITNSGAVYRIKGFPFHQNVLSNIHSTIPINIQIKAGTVKDIFGHKATAQVGKEVIRENPLGDMDMTRTFTTTMEFKEEKVSLTAAINSFFKRRTKESTQKDKFGKESIVAAEAIRADVWEFDMAPGIGNAKIQSDRFDALNTSGRTKKVYEQYSASLRGQVRLDKKKQLFRVNSGTNLIQLMNAIIVGSDYIDKNLLDEVEAAKVSKEPQGKQLQWFKIVPEIIDVVGWDSKAGRYKWHIKWTVVTNGIFYNDYAWAAQTKPKGKGVHKIYDYIFSGQNSEVLSFKLNLDAGYYNAITLGTGIPNAASDKGATDLVPGTNIVAQNAKTSGTGGTGTVTKRRSQDLMTNIMHDGTDLMMADLDIIGDPAYLPVGDALFQSVGNRGAIWNKPFLPDGTINYDLTPTYIQVNLKTPTDYNELTGFADPNQQHKYSSSQFSGVYQILKTKSTFSGGVFTQNLSGFRTKMQPIGDNVGRSADEIGNTERKAFQQDIMQQVAALQYLWRGYPGIANNLGAKITNVASSAITNIGTNIIGRIASEVNQNRNAIFFDADDAGTNFPAVFFDADDAGTTFPEETPAQRDARAADQTEILVT